MSDDVTWDGVRDDGEIQDDDDNEERGLGGRDSLIFLIDCRKAMFVKSEETNEVPFILALKCVESVTRNKIISNEKDVIGVAFFGTEKTNCEGQNTYVFQSLMQPGAEFVISLKKTIDGGSNKFLKDIGSSNAFSLSDSLWQCSSQFSKCNVKLFAKRIILFTNDDDPHNDSVHLRRLACQRVHDMIENGVDFDLIQMKKGEEDFDLNKFYKDILVDADNYVSSSASNKLDHLLSRIRRKEYKKRTVGRLTFSLPGGVEFAVGMYNLVRSLHKPSPVRLSRDDNEEVMSMRKTYLQDTGEILLPADVVYWQEFGGKQIYFEKEEVDKVKQFFEPGIVLLGFKPVKCLKLHHHCMPALFLYPDEHQINGSTCVFSALLQRCADRNVVAICRLVARKNTPPRFVALLPQVEQLLENGTQVVPPGFHVIQIPFADDIRALDVESLIKNEIDGNENKPDQNVMIAIAKEFVKKLKFSFKSENFENPVLQAHWRNVEALALDLDAADDMKDFTLPNDKMEERAGDLILEFKNAILPDEIDNFCSQAGKRQSNKDSGSNKRMKTDLADVDVAAEAKAGRLSKLTVELLKNYCVRVGIRISGKKKADLIEEITAYLHN